jgi:hypothetical protein
MSRNDYANTHIYATVLHPSNLDSQGLDF